MQQHVFEAQCSFDLLINRSIIVIINCLINQLIARPRAPPLDTAWNSRPS